MPLIKAFQEQQAQIEALKLQNDQMSQQNHSLQTQIDVLRIEIQSFRVVFPKQPGQTNNRNR